ncbi:LANO_0H24916g1_1 [Lachancea nothofagi CBS 11611]|uniref:LANO_0H24916g1_1 n=1 Tax=Lachancea nothofagi CBS 11611 TaxID=1266666 RepID=A0A1G4KNW4_9SACH|nr:LANO_0H24916g1_1 [Lachancea nothofagi CBS 11611]
MVDGLSVSVGCAVGIPCGIAVIVAFIFWYRMQRRFKKEMEDDVESMGGDGAISFRNMDALREADTSEKTDHAHRLAEASSSSDNTQPPDFSSTAAPDVPSSRKKGKSNSKSDSRRNTYMPAYRKKLNSSINSLQHSRQADELKGTNDSSSISLDTKPNATNNEPTVLDQMIPVMVNQDATNSATVTSSDFSLAHDKDASNDNLAKNLQYHDFGSYPRRRSSANLNSIAPGNISSSSIHTRSSSTHSQKKSTENVFDTPNSSKVMTVVPNADHTDTPINDENIELEQQPDYYMLKNNYDAKNADEIAEEDQYENEFTNYSENKREFINSLRPRKN